LTKSYFYYKKLAENPMPGSPHGRPTWTWTSPSISTKTSLNYSEPAWAWPCWIPRGGVPVLPLGRALTHRAGSYARAGKDRAQYQVTSAAPTRGPPSQAGHCAT